MSKVVNGKMIDVDSGVTENAEKSVTDMLIILLSIRINDVTSLQNECRPGNCNDFAIEQDNDEAVAHAFELVKQDKR